MQRPCSRCKPCIFLILISCLVPVWAVGDTTGDNVEGAERETSGTVSSSGQETISSLPFKVGIDCYVGVSNRQDRRRFTDGFWAGYGTAYPSVVYLDWGNEKGSTARVAVGIGKLYSDSDDTVYQPVEGWWQMPAGTASVTVGKFWVPFALQEWEYETKPGVMLQWAEGAYSLAASANYNGNTGSTNVYVRAGLNVGENLSLGLSLGTGKGLSYDSVHDRAIGLDGTFSWQGWQLSSEYVALRRHSSERFHFGYARLSYENLGRWKPFVARYSWKDRSDAFGQFRSTVVGVNYQFTPDITLEAAYAATSDKGVIHLQMRWTWQR